MSEPVRLSKRVVALLSCSRTEAEQYIEGGWVLVDGKVVEKPQTMVGDETVELAPGARLGQTPPATLLFHRPLGAPDDARGLAPDARWSEDRTGVRMLERHFVRQTSMFPLDPGASGLVIFTQDQRLARKMQEDGARVEQELLVDVSGTIVAGGLARMCHGLVFEGRPAPAMKVSWQSENRLRVATKAIEPGLLARMCEAVGLTWISTKRIRLGRVPLGKMPAGAWRYLPDGERI